MAESVSQHFWHAILLCLRTAIHPDGLIYYRNFTKRLKITRIKLWVRLSVSTLAPPTRVYLYLRGKDPVVIPNSEGRNTTPSVVAFTDGGERKVGDPAKRQAITNPQRTIYSIKRFMGESCSQVEQEIKRVPYKVVCGANNTPRVDIDGRDYTPQEVSAMILQKMKKTAEDYLGQTVSGLSSLFLHISTTPSVRPQGSRRDRPD